MTKETRKQLEQLIDSGVLREYIAAYCVCSLYAMNRSKEEAQQLQWVLHDIMMDTPAAAALELKQRLLP